MSSSTVQRIIVPVGGTDREFIAQEHAVHLARDLQAPVVAIHVAEDPSSAPSDIFTFITALGKRHSIPVEARTIAGTDVGMEMVAESGPLDLIVIGTRRIATKYHLSSVTQDIIHHAEGPVQVVRLEA